jgi:hypothetical protein
LDTELGLPLCMSLLQMSLEIINSFLQKSGVNGASFEVQKMISLSLFCARIRT